MKTYISFSNRRQVSLKDEIERAQKSAYIFDFKGWFGVFSVDGSYICYSGSRRGYSAALRQARREVGNSQWWVVRLSDGVVLAQNRAEEKNR